MDRVFALEEEVLGQHDGCNVFAMRFSSENVQHAFIVGCLFHEIVENQDAGFSLGGMAGKSRSRSLGNPSRKTIPFSPIFR